MKEKLINNLGIKILSVCLAAFFWIIIVNIDDPMKTRTFTNVPVQVLNESTLTSKNKAYDIVSGDTVDFTVSGKRTQLEKLKKTDFIATADLSQLTAPFDTVKINVECMRYSDVEITMGKVSTMTITLEDIISERFSVKVVTSGLPAPGYAADKTEVSPVLMEVSGAKSVIHDISDVKVLVDISGASSDVTRTTTPKAYNEKGVEIDSSKLRFSYKEVSVKVTILETKLVPVVLTQTGEVAYGYKLVDAAYEPQEIEIKGDSSNLAKVKNLPISIDVTNLTEDKEYTVAIRESLEPYGVSVVDSDMENIVVKVTVEKLVEKTINISKNDITFTNTDSDFAHEYTDQVGSYSIKLMGLSEDLEKITIASLSPRINLSGLEAGRHRVELDITLPQNVTAMNTVVVGIRLFEQKEEEPTISEKPEVDDSEDESISTTPTTRPSIQPSIEPSPEPSIEPSEEPVESEDGETDEDQIEE